MRLRTLVWCAAAWGAAAALLAAEGGCAAEAPAEPALTRVVVVQSYWPNYRWTLDVELGLAEAFGLPPEFAARAPDRRDGLGYKATTVRRPGGALELTFLYLDTKRRQDEAWKRRSAEAALAHLRGAAPDVVVLVDDNAQRYVGTPFAGERPIVFCGVNGDAADYYADRQEVTGFLERQRYEASVALLGRLCPEVRELVFLTDGTPTSTAELARVRGLSLPLPVVEIRQCPDFGAYRAAVLACQDRPHTALALFNLNFPDASQEEAVGWTLRHSRLPEVTFQRNTVEGGLLCAAVISGRDHGREAGRTALRILDGTRPAQIPIGGLPGGGECVNVLRVRTLGLRLPRDLDPSVERIAFAVCANPNLPLEEGGAGTP